MALVDEVLEAEAFIRLLRVPEYRPRTLLDVQADLRELADEIALARINDPDAGAMLGDAAEHLSAACVLVSCEADAVHTRRLAALATRCAACGHERGDHLEGEEHACEGALDLEGLPRCKCPGFLAPGTFRVERDTERPPAPASTEPAPA